MLLQHEYECSQRETVIYGFFLWAFLFVFIGSVDAQTRFTAVELNTENMFDTHHDSLKNDYEFLPESVHHWTVYRYWEKLNKIAQEIISCGEDSTQRLQRGDDITGWSLPDIVGLCEVENDTVLHDLTRRSLLRNAHYEYVMTDSPDLRGIDVALLYSPFTFGYISHHSLRITPLKGMRPTRDILYVSGRIMTGDTLHVFVVHAPSQMGGEKVTRPYRLRVAERLCGAIDSIRSLSPEAQIIAIGDFNDYSDSPSLLRLYANDMINVSRDAKGSNGAKGTYRYKGGWGSLDQIVVSRSLASKISGCRIGDMKFLLEEDTRYGGVKPKRFYQGPIYHGGYSDHLPLILHINF